MIFYLLATEVISMYKTALLFLLAAAVIVMAGCSPSQIQRPEPAVGVAEPAGPGAYPATQQVAVMVTQTSQPEATTTKVPSATVESTTAAAQPTPTAATLAGLGIATTTFTDEYAGFSLDYPEGWNITAVDPQIAKESIGYSTSLRSPMPTPKPKEQDGIQPGAYAIDMTVINKEGTTLEEAVAERRESHATDEFQPVVLAEDEWVLPSGLKAVRFLLETRNGVVASMVTVVNGREVIVFGFGELALFEPIAKSLRVTE
jgi:hypothetical protein